MRGLRVPATSHARATGLSRRGDTRLIMSQFIRDNIDSNLRIFSLHSTLWNEKKRREIRIIKKKKNIERKKNNILPFIFIKTKHEATAVNLEILLFLAIKVLRKEYLELQNYGQATIPAHACSSPVRQSTYTEHAVPSRVVQNISSRNLLNQNY